MKKQFLFFARRSVTLVMLFMCLFAGRAFSQCDNTFQFTMTQMSRTTNNFNLDVKLLSGTARGTTVNFNSPASGGAQTLSGIGSTVSSTVTTQGPWLCNNNTPYIINVTQDNGCQFSFLYSNYAYAGPVTPSYVGTAVTTTVTMPTNSTSSNGKMIFSIPGDSQYNIDSNTGTASTFCASPSSTYTSTPLTFTKNGLGTATMTNYLSYGGGSVFFGAIFDVTKLPVACTAPTSVAIAGAQTYCQNAAATPLTASFTGTVTGATYQWFANGTLITGATASTYTPPTTAAGIVNYTVTVTNGCGPGTSANYAVTTTATPSVPVITKVDPTCSVPAGSINVSSPVAGVTYTLMPGGTTNTTGAFTGLAAGSYTVTASSGTCTSGASNSVTIAASSTCVPDLTLTLDIDALNFPPAGSSKDFVVNLYEINGMPATNPIVFRINKLSAFTITYPSVSGNSNVFGGTANENSNWTITENASFITVTAKPGVTIPAMGQAVIGFNVARKTGVTGGTTQNIGATISAGSAGEVKIDNDAVITSISATAN